PPDRVRADQVLRRQGVPGGEVGDHLPAPGQPGGGGRVPFGPPVRRGRPLVRRGGGQRRVRQRPGLGQRRQPGTGQTPDGAAAEAGQRQQGPFVGGVVLGGGDDRRVR